MLLLARLLLLPTNTLASITVAGCADRVRVFVGTFGWRQDIYAVLSVLLLLLLLCVEPTRYMLLPPAESLLHASSDFVV